MTDLISRDDAIRELNGACSNWEDDAKVQEIVMALPSAEAVSRKAKCCPIAETCMSIDCPVSSEYIGRPSAEAVQGYTEWLEKIIVDAETFEWLCEDTTDKEWCEDNCHYSSIQAECLRHLYEVSKGGDSECQE